MNAILAGLLGALLTTVVFLFFRDKKLLFSIVLAAIGFLYIGFNWSDSTLLTVSVVQAVVFLLLAYYGYQGSALLLVAGYFLHGLFDLGFHFLADTRLMPPEYDMICLGYDWAIAAYLFYLIRKYPA